MSEGVFDDALVDIVPPDALISEEAVIKVRASSATSSPPI
jgi:hypothetical protein